jgi:hypothetical protein
MLLQPTLILAAFAATAACRPSHRRMGAHPAKAVYFMTNEAENAVVALPVGMNGSIAMGTTTSTGGAGGSQVSETDGAPNGPDALGSQASVQVADNVSSVGVF